MDFIDAVQSGAVEVVGAMLAKGSDPDMRDRLRRPALLIAAALPSPLVLKTLLAHGATPDGTDLEGRTALMTAAAADNADAVAMLLAAGADPSLFDKAGHDAVWHSRRRQLDFTVPGTRGAHATLFVPRLRRSRAARLIQGAASLRK